MALFRQNLNSGMNFLRRHFSSDDLYQDNQSDTTTTSDSYRMNLPHRKTSGHSFPSMSSVQVELRDEIFNFETLINFMNFLKKFKAVFCKFR